MDGVVVGSYMPEARSLSDTLTCVADSGQDTSAVFAPKRKEVASCRRNQHLGSFFGYQENYQRGMLLTTPLI